MSKKGFTYIKSIDGLSSGDFKLKVTPEMLHKIGEALVVSLSKHSKKAFAMRGWSGENPEGGLPVWDSFSYVIGEGRISVESSYPFFSEITSSSRERGRMTWLTQEAKDKNPAKYGLTKRERRLGMKRTGRVSKGERLPLIVPIKTSGGTILFRAAPLKMADAWIHPGVASFTFLEKAFKEGKIQAVKAIRREILHATLLGVSRKS